MMRSRGGGRRGNGKQLTLVYSHWTCSAHERYCTMDETDLVCIFKQRIP